MTKLTLTNGVSTPFADFPVQFTISNSPLAAVGSHILYWLWFQRKIKVIFCTFVFGDGNLWRKLFGKSIYGWTYYFTYFASWQSCATQTWMKGSNTKRLFMWTFFYFLTWVSHSHSPILQGSGSSAVGWSVQAHSERGVWKGRLSIILFTPLLSPEICSKRNCAVYSIVHCTTIMFCIVTSVEFSRTNQWTSVRVGRTTLPTEF